MSNTAVVEDAIEAVTAGPYESEEKGVVLHEVPWSLYCRLRDLRANWGLRMLYVSGDLHIVSPSRRHERYSRLLGVFIAQWALHKGVSLMGAGSTTYRRRKLKVGLEPDQCVYIERLKDVRPDSEPNLEVEPAPDLVIEVDVTHTSRYKLKKYALLGVTELWVWRKGLRVLVLEQETYREQGESRVLPGFPLVEAADLISRPSILDDTAPLREFATLIQGPPA